MFEGNYRPKTSATYLHNLTTMTASLRGDVPSS